MKPEVYRLNDLFAKQYDNQYKRWINQSNTIFEDFSFSIIIYIGSN